MQGPHLAGQPFPESSDGLPAGFDQQLAVGVAADVEPQEVAALGEVDDSRLVLVEGQTPGCQPPGESRLDLLGLFTAVTDRNEVIGLCRPPDYAERGDKGAGERANVLVVLGIIRGW